MEITLNIPDASWDEFKRGILHEHPDPEPEKDGEGNTVVSAEDAWVKSTCCTIIDKMYQSGAKRKAAIEAAVNPSTLVTVS